MNEFTVFLRESINPGYNMRGYFSKTILVFTALLFSVSCGKDRGVIPNVLVDITVNINNPSYINLTAVGGWMYMGGGSRGIVVYRYSTDQFNAFDRHCPYQAENSCGVLSVASDNVSLKCACCETTFLMIDGSLQAGPAVQPMRKYNTTFDGSSILRIYN
jgi:nitrite reductase/ring-hydroxylating ferredoxin subunit